MSYRGFLQGTVPSNRRTEPMSPDTARAGLHPIRYRLSKSQVVLGLEHLELVTGIGHIEDKAQRPTQQLGQCPDRSGKAKGLESPHP